MKMSIKSESELLVIYPWIKEELFVKVLQNQNNNKKITITNFHVKAALPKGENYGSQMIRATINYFECNNDPAEEFTTILIIKTDLKENEKLAVEFNFLLKEIIAHEQILPKVHELLSTINHNTRLSARCYDCSVNPFFMVFEDLTQRGYKNVNKEFGLNFEQFKIVILQIAKWHATTAVLMEKDKSLFKNHMASLIHEKSERKYQNILLCCADVIKNWDGFEIIAEKMQKLLNTVGKKCTEAYSIDNNEFNVSNHGDLWCNNVMFKLAADGKVEDAILVDYSIGFFGSPAFDLTNLLYASSNLSVKEKEWDQLLAYYHTNLITILNDLAYKGTIPTLTDIHMAILKHGVCSAIVSILVVGIRKLKDAENVDVGVFFGESMENHKMRFKILNDPKCKPELQYLFDYFNRKGYFD